MLYRFELQVSDIDRGVYERLEFRVAQHPSETLAYLLTRVLAYALNYQPNIEFSPGGLNDPDAPAIRVLGPHGGIELWIDIGNPSAKRLHKASKASKRLMVYTYKSASILLGQIQSEDIHRAADIQLFAVDADVLARLEARIEKGNRWSVLHQQGQLDIDTGPETFTLELKAFGLR